MLGRGNDRDVRTFIGVYVAVGFLVGFGLFGWLGISSVQRRGLRATVRGAARTLAEELPLYWRVAVAAWMFVIALPLIAAWAVLEGEVDAAGVISVTLAWLLGLALLRWHLRAKARARETPRRTHCPRHLG
jgi:hypothetical protein